MKAEIRVTVEVDDETELAGLASAMLDVATELGVPAGVGASLDGIPSVLLAYNQASIDLVKDGAP